MRIPDKGPNAVQEGPGQDKEKTVTYVRSISEIPDGYDAAVSNVQYVVNGPGHGERKEHGI